MQLEIIIIGAFHEVIELAEDNDIKIFGLVDNVKSVNYKGYPVLLNDSDGSVLDARFIDYPVVITPDSGKIRYKLASLYSQNGFVPFSLISNDSKISRSASINEGVIIQSGVNVSAEVRCGKFVKLNTMSNVMHNVSLGDYVTIAPNAVVLGNVTIGDFCYIGSNATILPNLTICQNVTIGAGSVVTKNIFEPGVYVGVPAQRLY